MVRIRIQTDLVQEVGNKFKVESDHLNQIGLDLQRSLDNLNLNAWDGHSRKKAEPLLARVRPESEHITGELSRLGQILHGVAEQFEQEDVSAAHNLAGMPWVDFEIQGGQVLGAVAAMGMSQLLFADLSLDELSKMTWKQRFDALGALRTQIPGLQEELDRLEALIGQTDADVADLEQKIGDLREQRANLEAEATRFGNKVRRSEDGWKWGFDDGIFDTPWRTRSDDYEDEIAELDEKIETLEAAKSQLETQRASYLTAKDSLVRQLQGAENAKDSLETIISDGIPGGTTPIGKRAGCVLYVSERRDISDFNGCGTPSSWEGRAAERGYDTGEIPVKGAIMVYDGDRISQSKGYCCWKDAKGKQNYVSTAGHVEYVTDVQPVEVDGKILYEITVEGASTGYDKADNPIWYEYCDQYTKSYTIDPESLPDGVWYLYDKKPV